MKRIILSLALIGVVSAVAVGATRAYFSDTVTISGNTFTAGTLDLKIDTDTSSSGYNWEDSLTLPASYFDSLVPGFSDKQIIDIKNVGGINSYATIKFESNDTDDLLQKMYVKVYFDGKSVDAMTDANTVLVASGYLSQWLNNTYTLGDIVSTATTEAGVTGQNARIRVEWSIPTSVGNEIQGDNINVKVTLGLEQKH